MTDRQKELALTLLSYLQTKENESTFTDDYYNYLKTVGYSELAIEQIVSTLALEEYINYLGKDRYWIQITGKGSTFVKHKGKTGNYDLKKTLEIIVAIVGIIGGALAIISKLC